MNNFNNPFSLMGPSSNSFTPNTNRPLFNPSPAVDSFLLGLHNPLPSHNFTHVTAPPSIISAPVMSSMPLCEPSKHVGTLLADPWGGHKGECVSFVKVCTGDHRQTALWGMGGQVKGNSNLVPGTAIATFGPDGKYAGGHAAVYMGQDQNGIQVMDQWVGHPVAPRTIRWDGATPSNNGSLFHVIN